MVAARCSVVDPRSRRSLEGMRFASPPCAFPLGAAVPSGERRTFQSAHAGRAAGATAPTTITAIAVRQRTPQTYPPRDDREGTRKTTAPDLAPSQSRGPTEER
jgi:hypothetical protein